MGVRRRLFPAIKRLLHGREATGTLWVEPLRVVQYLLVLFNELNLVQGVRHKPKVFRSHTGRHSICLLIMEWNSESTLWCPLNGIICKVALSTCTPPPPTGAPWHTSPRRCAWAAWIGAEASFRSRYICTYLQEKLYRFREHRLRCQICQQQRRFNATKGGTLYFVSPRQNAPHTSSKYM